MTPTKIRLDVAANQVFITWEDGHTSLYTGGWLRFICPCAECRGHAPGEVPPPSWERCKDVRATHVSAVGSYALRFTLSDGHDSGIYAYDTLRRNEMMDPDAWLEGRG